MSKALYGYLGEPRAYMLLKQISDLRARVEELEKMLQAAEAELLALRAIAADKVEEAKALA
jgi:ribosomal protein L29